MSVADDLIRKITKEIDALPTGRYGEVIFDERWLMDFPPLERFLEPPPDVWTDEHERRLREEQVLLGCYYPMRSPGRVLLFRRNLRAFFWSLIRELRNKPLYLTPLDLKGALRLVVTKTHQHELFHFHSDVLRHLFGGAFDPLLEEALAVAWSRLQITTNEPTEWRYWIKQMNGVVYHHLLPLAFAYRSPGYRDWHLYADQARFQAALLNYLAPPKCAWLQGNGVDLETLVFGMPGGISGGYVEAVV